MNHNVVDLTLQCVAYTDSFRCINFQASTRSTQ